MKPATASAAFGTAVAVAILLALTPALAASDSIQRASIPRSLHRSNSTFQYPPWSPSPMIDDNGFLLKMYKRVPGEWEKTIRFSKRSRRINAVDLPAVIRQVPGDGNCLFHSISTCCAYVVNGTHINLRDPQAVAWLYENSSRLRQQAVDCLERNEKLLFLQGNEYLKARNLVDAAASQYAISGQEYCNLMRQDSYWGGGPEIVALCNVLRRPIHVYELHVDRNRFVLRRMACFGSPKFDQHKALHILSADSRFPDILPGKQLPAGNHFLAIFPEERDKAQHSKQRLRGGHRPDQRNGRNALLAAPPTSLQLEDPITPKRRRWQTWLDKKRT